MDSASSDNSPSVYSDISKFSSKSSASAVSKELDNIKEETSTTSPIDIECNIQTERITKILDETIQKIKLALSIPVLMEEHRSISSVMSDEHLMDCMYIYSQFDSPLFSASYFNVDAREDIRTGELSLKNRLNPEISHMIHIVSIYPNLKPKIEEIIEKLKLDYMKQINDEKKQGGTGRIEFLFTFEKFRELMISQMETTAAEDLATKIHVRKLKKCNAKLEEKIEEYKVSLKQENVNFENTMKNKTETIKRLEIELALLKQEATVKLKKKILDSERQMVLASRAHDVKKEILKEEEVEIRDTYNNLLRSHLVDEKNMRARRFKVETQLLSWIQKYDLEMADKQLELDDFTDKYEDELQKCETLEAKLAEQDLEYIPLMEEREAEYELEMAEKMNKFLKEHAARVIQNAWREVLLNRAEKKRLKKLQKRMQAAAAAAEAAAAAAAAAAAKAAKAAAKKKKKE